MKPYFKELLGIFNAREVEYLVVGSYAVIFYTVPRFTKDSDVWVNPTEENARRVFEALQEYGGSLAGISWSDFTIPGNVYQMGVTMERIDVITQMEGAVFSDCWSRRIDFLYDGQLVHFLEKADLIANIKAVGRG